MTEAVLILAGIVTVLGCALYFLTRAASDNTTDQVIEKINALLPQTQCGQCNYPGCRPYAEAIATQNVPINQCPPGGTATIEQLAQLLGQNTLPLNADNGTESPPLVAWIHEDLCIGCKKCILACPVDAIMGAAKKMHTVIAAECTGCELCLEPCPVDCIDMIEISETLNSWRQARPQAASCGF